MKLREQYIHHPDQIPISLEALPSPPHQQTTPLAFGGLCCYWPEKISIGHFVKVCIPEINPRAQAQMQVCWRRVQGNGYELGLLFLNPQQAFEMRLTEQLCHITCYQFYMQNYKGRKLDMESAAHEWITRFAARFPMLAS